jgi:hypothetical protein
MNGFWWSLCVKLHLMPILKDAAGIDTVWLGLHDPPSRRLGTVEEVRHLFVDLKKNGYDISGMERTLSNHGHRGECFPVGDPNDVHEIIPPHNRIGYAIEQNPDGFTLETIELLESKCRVLRFRGMIVGIASQRVFRTEKYGGIRIG